MNFNYQEWKRNHDAYQRQQRQWSKQDTNTTNTTTESSLEQDLAKIEQLIAENREMEAAQQRLSTITPPTSSHKSQIQQKIFIFFLFSCYYQFCQETLADYSLTSLEEYYQRLIRPFSKTYLQFCEWYVGETLIDNSQFYFPLPIIKPVIYSNRKHWIKSKILLLILREQIHKNPIDLLELD